MGFDFLKKLFGEVKSIDDVIKAITPEKNEKNDEEESSSAKSNLNNVFSFTQVTNSVTWNGKLYGVKDSTIVVSNNDGGKWDNYTTLPISCKDIKISDDNQLMVLGASNCFDDAEDYWYKLDENGKIKVAKDPNHPDLFTPLAYKECKMKLENKNSYVRVYEIDPRNSFCSSDRVHWETLDGFFAKDFKEFVSENGITFAIDVDDNRYVYFPIWQMVAFEADMEIFEEQDPYYYEELKETYYTYKAPYDEEETIESKKMHLLFLKSSKSQKLFADLAYVNKEGVLEWFQPSLPGLLDKLPRDVESCCGEVIITMPNDKKYIFYDSKWREMEPEDDEKKVGPFCFETIIYKGDRYWNPDGKKSTGAREIFKRIMDGPKSSDEPKERRVYYKILKTYKGLVYYSNDGNEWFIHSVLPSEFKSMILPCFEKKGAIVFLKDKKYYQWDGLEWGKNNFFLQSVVIKSKHKKGNLL